MSLHNNSIVLTLLRSTVLTIDSSTSFSLFEGEFMHFSESHFKSLHESDLKFFYKERVRSAVKLGLLALGTTDESALDSAEFSESIVSRTRLTQCCIKMIYFQRSVQHLLLKAL